MSIKLYDLCGADESHRFSPYCWRVKAALAHKGVEFEAVATPFSQVKNNVQTEQKTLPCLQDGDQQVVESFDIALYLDEKFPDKPSLFKGEESIAAARFVQSWANSSLIPLIIKLVIKDVHSCLAEEDQVYFRQTREKVLGAALEDIYDASAENIEAFRKGLTPLRLTLASQPFIGGSEPLYADFIVYGMVKWVAKFANFDVLAADDPVKVWFDAIDQNYQGV